MPKAITTIAKPVEVTAIVKVIPRRETRRAVVHSMLGESVDALCRRAFPGFHATCYSMNGRRVDGDAQATGANVVCWAVPSAEMAAAIIPAMLIGFAASVVMSGVVSLIDSFHRKKREQYEKETMELSDTQYGWDYNSRNAEAEGAPIPILYGRRMVIPPIVQQHSYTLNNSLESFAELVYAVADGGGGFGDRIVYPLDSDGNVQALLDHTSWLNYNSDSMSSDTRVNSNRIDGDNIFANATFDGTTLTGTKTGGGYSTTTLADGIKTGSDALRAAMYFGGAVTISNFIFKIKERCIPTSCVVCSFSGSGSYSNSNARGVKGFTLYGWSGSTWVALGSTSTYSYSSPNLTATLSLTPGTNYYTVFRIADISWMGSGTTAVSEIELWGQTGSSGTIPGGYCAISATNGTLSQSPSALTSKTYASLNVQKKLDTNYFSFSSTRMAAPDILVVHLEFPYGLYNYENGAYGAETVVIACRYRPVATDGTEGNWTNFFNSSHQVTGVTISGAKATISMENQKSLKLSFERTGLNTISGKTLSHYDVQMRFNVAPTTGINRESTCIWAGLDEGWDFTCAYPRTATATMKLLASETLSGDIPQFKILAERKKLNVYNPLALEWQEKAGDNPAWAVWDLLVRPIFNDLNADIEDEGTRAGNANPVTVNSDGALLREQFPHEKMIYSEFAAWADFCDAEGITCSMYYDSTSNIESAIGYLCDIGRAQLVNRGGKVGVTWDHKIDACAYAFGDGNIVKDSWSVSYRDVSEFPTEVEVTFFDKEREWNRFTVSERDPDADAADVFQNTESVTLYACDDRAVAQAHARYLLGRRKIRRTFKWTGCLDSMPCDIGDVVWVYGDRVRITAATYDEEYRRVFEGEEYVTTRFEKPPAVVVYDAYIDSEVVGNDIAVFAYASTMPITVDFGDGSDPQTFAATIQDESELEYEDVVPFEKLGMVSHAWATEGTHTVAISAHKLAWIGFEWGSSAIPAYVVEMHRFELNDISYAFSMFDSCSLLTFDFPITLWKAKDTRFMFAWSSIGEVHGDIRCPKSRKAAGMFIGCEELEVVSPTFKLPHAADVDGIFEDCLALQGGILAEDWWDSPAHTSHDDAFAGCTALGNYDDIPTDWK